jgi:hypothetical protein
LRRALPPYGYTLTLWTQCRDHPRSGGPFNNRCASPFDWGNRGLRPGRAVAFGSVNGVLSAQPGGNVRVWGAMHLPTVGLSVLACSLIAQTARRHLAWPLVGFTATAIYLFVLSGRSGWPPTEAR